MKVRAFISAKVRSRMLHCFLLKAQIKVKDTHHTCIRYNTNDISHFLIAPFEEKRALPHFPAYIRYEFPSSVKGDAVYMLVTYVPTYPPFPEDHNYVLNIELCRLLKCLFPSWKKMPRAAERAQLN